MPVTNDEPDGGEPGEAAFSDHVNAVMTFSDGWVLQADRAGYPGAGAEGCHLDGAGDDPPVRAAIDYLTKAMAAKPSPEADNGDAEAVQAHTHGQVVEFEVPEGSTTVRARVAPEVTMKDGEIHARVKVDDPNWTEAPSQPDS
jgi:hypothetical protein